MNLSSTNYEELNDFEKVYVYKTFLKFIVRKEVSAQNEKLKTYFSKTGNDINAITQGFTFFNNAFVDNFNLIRQLSENEVNSNYLKDISTEHFNEILSNARSFDRKIALISFCGRPNENIPNRVEYPVLVSYANMQRRVLNSIQKYPNSMIWELIKLNAKGVRTDFENDYNFEINETSILPECNINKTPGVKTAKLWKQMIVSDLEKMRELNKEDARQFVLERYCPTIASREKLEAAINHADINAEIQLNNEKEAMKKLMLKPKKQDSADLEFDDFADIADFDETFTSAYAESVYNEAMNDAIRCNLYSYLDLLKSKPKEKPMGTK